MKNNLKVILLGQTNVGKTSIIQALIDSNFKQKMSNTLGVCFHRYQVQLNKNNKVNIDIWDTAGQQKYRSLLTMYYKNTQGVIIVFDITNPNSFLTVKYWAQQIQNNCQHIPCITLVGNKWDLNHDNHVQQNKIMQFLNKRTNWRFFYASAKQNYNIQQIFKQLAQRMLQTEKSKIKQQASKIEQKKKLKNKKKTQSRSCC